jgi:serine/threonine protein kinase
MFCHECGTSNVDGARFCSSCGKKLATSEVTASTETVSDVTAQTGSGSSSLNRTIGSNPTMAGSPGASAPRLLVGGERFADRYEIVRLIGRGGMGAVYEAKDSVINEPVALKVLLGEIASHPEAISRFTREARISRQLSHKHIVRVHDIASHDDMLYISMELVGGVNLRRFFETRKKKEQPLSIREILTLAKPICEAMEYAHEITVHRDLKPENILVARDGQVKVSDFGIATLLQGTESRLTSGALGTAYYMAPEQLDARQSVDRRADIYSLGVMLYEAAVGKVPVGRFKTLRECREDVPAHFDEAIMRALEPDPEQRPETMRQFFTELRPRQTPTSTQSNQKGLGTGDRPAAEEGSKKLSPLEKARQQGAAGNGGKTAASQSPSDDTQAAKKFLEKGKTLLEQNQAETALELLEEAVAKDPQLAEAWFLRGQAISKAKLGEGPDEKWKRVAEGKITLQGVQQAANDIVDSFKKATECEPDNAMYRLTAMLAEQQIKSNNGLAGTEQKPKAAEPAKGGGMLKGLFGRGGGGENVEAIIAEGNLLLNTGNPEGAVEKFEQALKKNRKCAAAWYGKGLALGKSLGDDQAAVLAKVASGEMDLATVQRIGADAKDCLRKAYKLEPSNSLYQMVASQLQ